jgi:hypothetical protein
MTHWRRSAAATIALWAGLAAAQTLLQETFDSTWSTQSPPDSWRIAYTAPAGSSDWHRAPDLGPNPWVENPTPYALLFRDSARMVSDSLISPVLDCRALTNVVLRCSTAFIADTGLEFSAAILGSVDGGLTWPFLARRYLPFRSQPPTLESLALGWATGQSQVTLAWVFAGNTGGIGYWALDNVSVTGEAPSPDVAVSRILAPVGVVDSGAVLTPRAVVANRGNERLSFIVDCRIGTDYLGQNGVDGLAPGDSQVVQFGSWIAGPNGILPVTCSTELVGDVNPGNDVRRDSVLVRSFATDVGVIAMLVPGDTVDSAQSLYPVVTVQNYGQASASFPVLFRASGYYQDSQYVADLSPGSSVSQAFRPWMPFERGTVEARCSIALADDGNPQNDTLARAVFVRVADVGVSAILAPTGALPESTAVLPSIVVANYGNSGQSFWSSLHVLRGPDTVYTNVQTANVAAGARETTDFVPWIAAPSGIYRVLAQTLMPGDANPANDRDTTRVAVGTIIHDVGVTQIIRPRGRIPVGPIQPCARLRNFGQSDEAFPAFVTVQGDSGPVYRDSVLVPSLDIGRDTTVVFALWSAPVGSYAVTCSVALALDTNPTNDFLTDSVIAESAALGWLELDTLPAGLHRKGVKGGGALVTDPSGMVYALKGGTNEFYGFDQSGRLWATCCTIPYSSSGKKKKVGKGGALAWAGSRVYAFKGSNTPEFWAYDPMTNAWSEGPVVPGDKRVKGGAGLVTVPSRNALFAFKGNNTSEFLCYDIAGATWSTRQPIGNAPPPGKARAVKDGGSLTLAIENGDSLIFAFKGGGTREFWRYSISGDSWHYVDSVPYGPTKKTKVKDGAALTWNGTDRIYAVKGGKTAEFWAYQLAVPADAWLPLAGIPGAKLLATGAALNFGNGFCYALKGGGTKEFWRFYEPSSSGVTESPAPAALTRLVLTIAPNPFTTSLNPSITCSLPVAGKVSLKLYDVTGKLLRILRTGQTLSGVSSFELRVSGFPRGVYVLKLETRAGGLTKKLVIE